MGEQGLQDKIKLVPLDLQNRPDWYKEKVYPANKVNYIISIFSSATWMLCESILPSCVPWQLN
jgi:hypothetical protein